MALAARFKTASLTAIGISKVLLNKSFETDQKTMAELEAMGQGAAVTSAEHRAAVERFLSKQPLEFQGFSRDDWKGATTS